MPQIDGGISKVRFGPFELNLSTGELSKLGVRLRLPEQSFKVLLTLIQRPGELVTREELQEPLWDKHSLIDFDHGLNLAVARLRAALGDDVKTPRYLETLPRRGYRFLAVVEIEKTRQPFVEPSQRDSNTAPTRAEIFQKPDGAIAEAKGRPEPESLKRFTKWQRLTLWIVSGTIVALVIGLGLWRFQREPRTRAQSSAEQAYRLGMALLQEGNLPKVRQGADELRQAVQYDPTFALAWAGLADAAILLDPTTGDIAIDYAQKAVRLNPDCGECHAILGRLLFSTKWQWEQAGLHLDKAVALKRDDPDILMARAQWEAALGRTTQALEILDSVGRRFPQKLNTGAVRAQYLYYGRKYESAILESDRLTAMNLSSGLEWKANALFQLGRYAEAVYALHGFLGSWSSASPETIASRRNAAVTRFEQAGLPGVMGDLLRLTASPPAAQVHAHNRARWLMLLGKHEQAVNELQVAMHAGLGDMIFLNVEPVFDPLRSNPEFRKLLKQLRLA